jgi:asparagine synthase (glutamine-hydrolysing)
MPGAGLGQRRLAIIDLSPDATAPLSNEDGTIWVVLNGEIYNFQSLRADLMRRGHTFRTRTDTEVVVHAYEEFGVDCLSHLRGMFAVALWDSRRQLFFAARDRLGKKPFCYARSARSFVFASELKALLASGEVSTEIDYRALDDFLTYQSIPSPRTAYLHISKLPAAHYLTCDRRGEVRIERYWSPPMPRLVERSEEDACSEIRSLLRSCVAERMISDVPLGAFLSGGVDSATIVALMSEQSSSRVKTFSIGLREQEQNELPWARLVAERYDTDHHELIIEPEAIQVLPELVRQYDEPFADPSAVPTYYLSQLTRQFVTVALSGDGADENFAGYRAYGDVLRWNRLDVAPRQLRQGLARAGAAATRALPGSNTAARIERALAMAAASVPERYWLHMSLFKPQEKRAYYTSFFAREVARQNRDQPVPSMPVAEPDALAWMMRHDLGNYLPDCLMVKTDIASMANSLEVRCPFLDHRFIEFTATIPSEWKRKGSASKHILKNAVRDLVPVEILNKPKTGFGIPVAKWLRTSLLGLLRENLTDDRFRRRGLFQPDGVASMIDQHVRGVRDWSNRLWALLVLELWFREVYESASAEPRTPARPVLAR